MLDAKVTVLHWMMATLMATAIKYDCAPVLDIKYCSTIVKVLYMWATQMAVLG